ncbi:hypothetical protein AB0N09_27640 [Streptomyces erythrochromogenes]|uniref:hypothetical protein n=1 Tax=Streptomyces erythrochromogenes TaxID=285574 RepID=UPI00342A15A0
MEQAGLGHGLVEAPADLGRDHLPVLAVVDVFAGAPKWRSRAAWSGCRSMAICGAHCRRKRCAGAELTCSRA